MQNYNAIIDCFSTVKFGDKELLVVQNLFTKARLFTIYELNWQIGQGKWFTIAKFSLSIIYMFFITKFNCIWGQIPF